MESSRRQFVLVSLASCLAGSTGCGLLIYPERKGQPHGRLDWGIVMLDGLGLLLFLVPGVIAFIVDFSTGTIYLPPEGQGGISRGKEGDPLTRVELPRGQMTRVGVEKVVSDHVGRPVRLQDGGYRTERLGNVDEYWPTVNRIAGGQS